MKKQIRIATRQSPLALWQANYIKQELVKHYPTLAVELVGITTKGDKYLDTPLQKIGGKGLFIKELETSLLAHETDIAVHSMKDVPAEFPAGLCLGMIAKRADPRDVLISQKSQSLATLAKGAIIGTSSLRRQSQLLHWYPHLQAQPLRGNVGTRLCQLEQGNFDAIILAAAGLARLGQLTKVTQYFEVTELVPAAGQGAIGVECRDEEEIKDLLKPLADLTTTVCVRAERAMTASLNSSCLTPIAAYAVITDQQLCLHGVVGMPDGSQLLTVKQQGTVNHPEKLGLEVAQKLRDQGADRILELTCAF